MCILTTMDYMGKYLECFKWFVCASPHSHLQTQILKKKKVAPILFSDLPLLRSSSDIVFSACKSSSSPSVNTSSTFRLYEGWEGAGKRGRSEKRMKNIVALNCAIKLKLQV